MESGSCPACMGLAGSAVISSRQAGSFKESFSKVWALNSSETHWPTFPCGPFIYQEMKLVTGFLTLPNLTDEIQFLPKFRRSINSLLLSSTSLRVFLGRGNPHHHWGLRSLTSRGAGLGRGADRGVGLGASSVNIKRWPLGWDYFSMLLSSFFKLRCQFHRTDFSIFKNESL